MPNESKQRRGSFRKIWARIRRIWVTLGLTATIIFVGWSLIAFQASREGKAALAGSAQVSVDRGEEFISFGPTSTTATQTGLIFFPGGLVDPVAYAPLAREIAANGFPTIIVKLPRRGVFGGADDQVVIQRGLAAMKLRPGVRHWFIGGHSKGGAVAARFAHENPAETGGLILLGTSHPRGYSLATLDAPVTKLIGTRDGLAGPEKCEATRGNLPSTTKWIVLDGANHSQFGCYGFQPGDLFATITRGEQQRQIVEAMVAAMRRVESH